ncbi:hypothetical protein ACVNIS_17180 [Sphaerotilaceae bacterium SBD11-9]
MTLKTTSKATRAGKPAPQIATRSEAAEPQQPPQAAAKAEIKTLLVASCGWPTEAMQPSRRQTARR